MLLKPAACFVLGSLLAAGGPGSVESCLLASLPGEDSLCSMNATPWSSRDPRFPTRPGCHPLWCQDAAHPSPELQPVVPIIGLFPQKSARLPHGVRCLKTLQQVVAFVVATGDMPSADQAPGV